MVGVTARIAIVALIAGLALASPAAAAKDDPLGSAFIGSVRGTITETVTFTGDQATCAASNRCGYSGTLTSTFTAGGDSSVVLLEDTGFGFLTGAGVTTATVTTADGAPPCQDEVSHEFTYLSVEHGTAGYPAPDFAQLIDPLANRCGGPLGADVLGGRPLLGSKLPRDVSKRRTLRIAATGSRQFTASGFTGTVSASMDLALRRTKKRPGY